MPGRAHLQDINSLVVFVAACDRGGGKCTAGEHSRAARRELRREALRRAARRNEGRGIRDGASEQDGTEHYEKAGRQSGRAEQRLDSAAGCRPEVVWGVKTRTGRTPASTRVLHNGVAHGTPFLILTPVRSTPLAPARARRSWQSSCWGACVITYRQSG